MEYEYSDVFWDHFQHPRNVGTMEDPDGVGRIGSPVCGDMMEVYIRVQDGRIGDIRCRTFGCSAAIAAGSIGTQMARGLALADAEAITDRQVAQALGGLPERKMHCSNLAASAVRAAIEDYRLGHPRQSAAVRPAGNTDRVVVAMSGGVDSSATAALLHEQGYDVVGVTMRLWKGPDGRTPEEGCCGPDAVEDARRVCDVLGIEFHELDYTAAFKAAVVDYFVETYSRAHTPNPCIACNRHIKFRALLDQARQDFGAAYLATGHYVRNVARDDGRHLLKGVDLKKDQSYVLYMLGQNELGGLLFPLGDYTKEHVREMARLRRLPVAGRAESQEICFVTDNDYRRFLREHAPDTLIPGPILDRAGAVVGRHQGLPFYTVGQRSGLGVSAPQPLYVLEIDPGRNALVVGTAIDLGHSTLRAEQVSYVSGEVPVRPLEIEAKIRYNARPAQAILYPEGEDRAEVRFRAPLRDITPGQSVVFYHEEEVLGGGTISSPGRDSPSYS